MGALIVAPGGGGGGGGRGGGFDSGPGGGGGGGGRGGGFDSGPGVVWRSQPLAKNVGSGTDSVLDLSVSQCTLQANQIQTS